MIQDPCCGSWNGLARGDSFVGIIIFMDWKRRIDRINRLKEKGEFDRVVMPVSYVGMGIGILVLGWQGITVLAEGKSDVVALVVAGVVIVLPGFLTLFRYFRGHFSKRLIA